MDTLLIFFLNRIFLDRVEKNQKPFFFPFPFLYIILNGAQNFKYHIWDSDWINFLHFLGYKYKIRLVLILRKREDQALKLDIHHSKVFSSDNLIYLGGVYILQNYPPPLGGANYF